MHKRSFRLAALPIALVCCAGPCSGEEYRYRGEVFGAVGAGKTYDDEGSLGSGFNGGVGVGYRIRPKLGVEFELSGFRHERETSAGLLLFRGNGAFATGNAVYYFGSGTGRAQPYVIGGAGVLHKRNTSSFQGEPRLDFSGTGFALNGGTGVKIFVKPRFSIRPEFRVFAGGAGSRRVVEAPFVVIRASIGAAYHW